MDSQMIVFTRVDDESAMTSALRSVGIDAEITAEKPHYERELWLTLDAEKAGHLFRNLQATMGVWAQNSEKGREEDCSLDELPDELRPFGEVMIHCHWAVFLWGTLWGGRWVDEVRARPRLMPVNARPGAIIRHAREMLSRAGSNE